MSQYRSRILLLGGVLLAGCVAGTTSQAPPDQPAPTPYSTLGLEHVIGNNARGLIGQFGNPDLDAREGPARRLQFISPICVLDAYLYAPRGGGEPVVTHVDARLPDGREMDRSSCVAALGAEQQAR